MTTIIIKDILGNELGWIKVENGTSVYSNMAVEGTDPEKETITLNTKTR